MANLLPCPFCGEAARMFDRFDADDIQWVGVCCTNRDCRAEVPGKWFTRGNDCPQLRQEVIRRGPTSSPSQVTQPK
jgi:hypothetical protein